MYLTADFKLQESSGTTLDWGMSECDRKQKMSNRPNEKREKKKRKEKSD